MGNIKAMEESETEGRNEGVWEGNIKVICVILDILSTQQSI